MELNVINNKNFTFFFLNKSKWKRNIIYHFLVEIKPHERIDLSIAAIMNIYQTKKKKKNCIPIVMKTCFPEEKLIKKFGPPFLREFPPFN